MAGAAAPSSIDDLWEVLTLLPQQADPAARLAIRNLLGCVFSHFLEERDAATAARLYQPYIIWTGTNGLADEWREDVFGLVESWSTVLDPRRQGTAESGGPHRDPRVQRVIQIIDERYSDPDLTLRRIASALNLSASRLARMLKQETGQGFVAHVHARRIKRARNLLAGTPEPVKEIAIDAGYRNSSELGRHFRAVFGMTPHAYRGTQIANDPMTRAKSDDT